MPITICKTYGIEAAHYLDGHYGKCAYMHGHHYKFELELTGVMTDTSREGVTIPGILLDFSYLKRAFDDVVGPWDHGLLMPLTPLEWEILAQRTPLDFLEKLGLNNYSKIFCLGINPTAENLAISAAAGMAEWLQYQCPVYSDLHTLRVRVWETETCWAEFTVPLGGLTHD